MFDAFKKTKLLYTNVGSFLTSYLANGTIDQKKSAHGYVHF